MRKIDKGAEPSSLTTWKRRHPHERYADITEVERQAIREACKAEQSHLCAYCCTLINDLDCHNEHVEAQSLAPNRTLDYGNIVASCNTKKQCGDSHGSQLLPLTPLLSECETELKFYLTGRVKGLTDRAKETIRVLNLGDDERNNRLLINTRKQLIDILIYESGEHPDDIRVLDDDLLEILLDDMSTLDNGQLKPFSPVLANILRGWLTA